MLSAPPQPEMYMQRSADNTGYTHMFPKKCKIYMYAEKCKKVGQIQPLYEIFRTIDIYLIGVRTNKRNVYPSRGRLKTTTNVCTSICNTHPRKVYDLKSSAVIRIQTERNGKP